MLDGCKSSLQRIVSILPSNRDDGDFEYGPEEIDKIRAYFLLAHAEIETYIENCLSEIVTKSYEKWKAEGTVDSVLLGLVAYYHPAIDKKDPEKNEKTLRDLGAHGIVELSKKAFDYRLRNNHGVKSKHIEKMLKVCGFDLETNSNFLADLEGFSTTRGEYAHNASSESRRNYEPPKSARRTVDKIIAQLDILEAHRVKLIA